MENSTTFNVGDLTHLSLRCRCGASTLINLTGPDPGEGRRLRDMVRRQVTCPCGLVLWSTDDEDPARDLVFAIIKARRQQSAVDGVGLVVAGSTDSK